MFAVGNSQHSQFQEDEDRAIRLFIGSGDSHATMNVLVHRKLLVNRRLISSRQKRVTKRNRFTVAYTDPEPPHPVQYGTVEKLVTIYPDSDNATVLALVKPLNVVRCKVLETLAFPSQLEQYFQVLSSDCVSVCNPGCGVVAVLVENICLKCFDISTLDYHGLTPLIDENEKDL